LIERRIHINFSDNQFSSLPVKNDNQTDSSVDQKQNIMHTKIYILLLSLFSFTTTFSQCIGEQGTLKWYYWEGISGYDLDDLYAAHEFPQSPKGFEEITTLQAPSSYAEGLGAIAKGYIKPDVTNTYTFNVTGTDHVLFFLSPTNSPSDTVLIAEMDGWTHVDDHDKYPSQTSVGISLTAGEYYYFEMHQKDDNGWDHAQVYWKTSPSDPTWSIVPNINLYSYECYSTCPVKGTPCNDGDSSTTDDQEDGACNCIGTPSNIDNCAGERGSIRAFYWDNIPGGDVYDLQSHPNYPASPDRTELLTTFKGPGSPDQDDTGTRVQAFLIIPQTGDYQFATSGDDETWLYFAESGDFNLATVIAEVPGWTYDGEFDKYQSQQSGVYSLTKGQICYIEINSKQGVGGERFGAAWITPFNDNFKYIDATYLYYYECEEACIPAGTPCDDGDNTTHSDAYDANCNCVGTPCPNGDCTGLGYEPSFPNYDKCGPTDEHNNDPEDAWLSCMTNQSPNPARDVGHWIQYDFKQALPLDEMKVWNYNVAGETGRGFREVAIDYSVDGINWIELGQYNWQQAPGTNDYEGFAGPDFGGVQAQYVLVTSLDNFDNGNCAGFSQIQFTSSACAQAGQACNPGNGQVGVYDINCDCRDLDIAYNDCANIDLTVDATPINTNNYSARETITSVGIINSGSTVNMVAGMSITLRPGFRAKNGADFLATIQACDTGEETPESDVEDRSLAQNEADQNTITFTESSSSDMIVYPTPTSSWTTINFRLTADETINLNIYSSSGQRLSTLASQQFYEAGDYQKRFPAQRLAGGVYYVQLETSTDLVTKSMIVVDGVQ
jgi:hypothetical protein